ncbi:MAG: FAD-dependent oxidoreductase [Candidatus Uhrbacteria bacterium]
MQQIVIVGGGFVGLRATRRLQRLLRGKVHITLVDRRERFVFSPWLIDGLAGSKNETDYSATYAALAAKEGWIFEQSEAISIDRYAKLVDLKTINGASKALPYDWLIVSPGSHIAFYGVPGAETNAYTLKSLNDVKDIHDRLAELVASARLANESSAANFLRFVIVGGGPSGIESLFALKQYLTRELLYDSPRLAGLCSFTIIDGGINILGGFNDSIVSSARKALERQSVHIENGDAAASIETDGVVLKSGKRLDASFVLWSAGVAPNDLSAKPDLPRDTRRTLQSDPCLQLEHAIYGAGDGVTVLDSDGKPASKTAQTAMLESQSIIQNISRSVFRKDPRPYKHRVHGFILTFGDTGYFDTPIGGHMFPTVVPLREIFYRFRFWQMTGK